MATSFGGSIKLQGESEYRKALNNITDNLKVLSSELKVVSSQYDKNDKSVSNLSSQNTVLNKKIDEQKQKVELLKKALENAKTETGENSTTTKKWQNELNNAQAELNKLEKNVKDNTKAIDNFGKEEEDASQSTIKLGDIIKANLISDAIIGGIKALGSAMKTVGGALIDLGKDAIANYSEFEQLVGGVETLFKESSDIVLGYANDAYKNAGLSANEYMETVTSFSASLLQSLGGDTEKASQYANRAIIDMSDNANKMGTDMSMIQSAYQAFAKQNYVLLDNLKLGYGGTKTEMERLIKDASQMTDIQEKLGITVDGSSLSFGNIVNAISVMQESLGIAGTTADEAKKTIQGSTNAMKSAWQNLVTGIADDNANFDQLINNFVDSTVIAMQNLLPRITQAVSGIGKLIGGLASALLENLPMIIEAGTQMISGISSGIVTAIPTIIPVIQELVNSLFTYFSEQAPLLIEQGALLLDNLGQGLQENIPNFITKGLDLLQGFADFLTENVPILIQSGMSFISNMVQGLMDALPTLIERVPVLISQFANVINDNAPTIIAQGVGIIWNIITGLIQAIPTLIENIPQIIQAIVDVWQAFDWINLGKNAIKFLGDGITSMISFAKTSMTNIRTNVVQAIQNLPQTLFNIGKTAISDMGNAISSMLSFITGKAREIATGVFNTIKSYLSFEKLASIGTDMIKGLWNGISNMTGWIMDKIGGFASGIINGVKGFFGIHSPSTVFKNEVGKNLALGLGEGFVGTMEDVTKDITNSIPTQFDANVNTTATGASIGDTLMVNAFKEALKDVKVVMNDREMGTFVVETVGKVVYA